jgi:recombination protein RecA
MPKNKTHRPIARVAEDKEKAASAAILEIIKKHGEGSVKRIGDEVNVRWPCIPTGIYTVDNHVIGIGGVPRKRITEIYGPESGGKTTLSLGTIAEAQAMGELAAFIDAEHALDPTYAHNLGVNVDDLIVSQPDHGEQALDVTEELIRSGAFGIVVVDSVAALVPQAELDGEMGDSNVGLHARLMSQAMRKLAGAVAKTNTALVFINQIREKIGVMFGNPETTTGGRALKFAASVRLDVRRTATNKMGEEAVSNTVRIKGAKNKMGSPYREAEVKINFGTGFDKVGSVIEAGIANGAIEKSGSWLSFQGERLGQGAENASAALHANSEWYERVYSAVLTKDQESRERAA